MPRKSRTFTKSEVARVRRMHKQGASNNSIAAAIGLRPREFEWHLRDGKFGHLRSRQGSNTGWKLKKDSEKDGICYGQKDEVWKATRDEIKSSWSSDEAARRSRSIMPNRERPYNMQWLTDDPRK